MVYNQLWYWLHYYLPICVAIVCIQYYFVTRYTLFWRYFGRTYSSFYYTVFPTYLTFDWLPMTTMSTGLLWYSGYTTGYSTGVYRTGYRYSTGDDVSDKYSMTLVTTFISVGDLHWYIHWLFLDDYSATSWWPTVWRDLWYGTSAITIGDIISIHLFSTTVVFYDSYLAGWLTYVSVPVLPR